MLYLKMIFRSWRRSWMSSMISIVSLVVGLTCSTMILLFVLSEYRIANALGDTQSVFQIETDDSYYTDGSVRSSNIPPKVMRELSDRYSQIESLVPVIEVNARLLCGESKSHAIAYIVTPEFADMFHIDVVVGDLRSTLSARGEIAVTDKFMQQHFGRPARLGETIQVSVGGNSLRNGVPSPSVVQDMVVTTILAEPDKTPFLYSMLMTLNVANMSVFDIDINETKCCYSFVKLRDADKAEEFETKINADSTSAYADRKLYLRPFSDVYLNGAVQPRWGCGSFIQRRDPTLLSIGLTVSLLVLVIAAFNYVNITMTRARGRLRNLAAQRIFGASKRAVRFQTVLDTLLLVLLSFGVSLLLIGAMIANFNSFMQCSISLNDLLLGWNLFIIVGLLVLVVGFSSLYILLKIDTANMIETLKNPMGRGMKISSVMVVAQFVISIALVAVSINISRQLTYISTSLPSFKSVILVHTTDALPMSVDFVDHVSSMPWIEGSSFSNMEKGASMSSGGQTLNTMSGGNDVFKFYDFRLIEGRMFEPHDSANCVIVNETLIHQFNLTPPVAGSDFEFMETYHIVGVVEDFIYEDAHKKIQSLGIVNHENYRGGDNALSIYLKISGNVDNRTDDIQSLWTEKYPSRSGLQIKTMPQIIRERHASDERISTMVDMMMGISLLLTAIGLFGLAFYTVARRTREIAIRKVHGSTTTQVVLLLCRTFVVWIGIAATIALPVAYFVSDWWLSGFVYRVQIEWWVFALTLLLISVVAFVTVIFQTWSAARANPANSIKAE